MLQYQRWMSIFRIYRKEIRIPFVLLMLAMPALELYSLFRQFSDMHFEYSVKEYNISGYYYIKGVEAQNVNILWAKRLELIFEDAVIDKIFLAALALLIILLVAYPLRQGRGESFYYAVNRLPVHRSAPFLMQMLHVMYSVMLLYAVQLATVFAGAVMYAHMVPEAAQRQQSLFMAFMEWDFLLRLFPIYDVGMIVCNFIGLFSLAICVTVGARGMQYGYKNYLSSLFVIIILGITLLRTTETAIYGIIIVLSLFITAYQVWVLFDKILPGKEADTYEEE